MKKLIFIALLYFISPAYGAKNFVGPYLASLKMKDVLGNRNNSRVVDVKYPAHRIYQINVLQQGNTKTCARHALKNAIYLMHALAKQNRFAMKAELKKIYDQARFNYLNRTLCSYMGIRNILQTGTKDPQLKKAFQGIYNNYFQNKFRGAKHYLPVDVKNILRNIIWNFICPKNSGIIPLINGNQYYNNNKAIVKILKYISPGKEVLKRIYNFKNSNKETLGLILSIPNDIYLRSFHAINLIIRKVNNSFEYFILDSDSNRAPQRAYWLKPVMFIKYLFTLSKARLQNLIRLGA